MKKIKQFARTPAGIFIAYMAVVPWLLFVIMDNSTASEFAAGAIGVALVAIPIALHNGDYSGLTGTGEREEGHHTTSHDGYGDIIVAVLIAVVALFLLFTIGARRAGRNGQHLSFQRIDTKPSQT